MQRSEIIEQCDQIEKWFEQVNTFFGTSFQADKAGRREVTEYIGLLLSCDSFEPIWLEKSSYQQAGICYNAAKENLDKIYQAETGLCQLIHPACESIDNREIVQYMDENTGEVQSKFLNFLEQYQQAAAKGLSKGELETEEEREKAAESLSEEIDILQFSLEFLEEGRKLIKKPLENSEKGLICMDELVHLLNVPDTIPENWITEKNYNNIARFFLREDQLAESIMETEAGLTAEWKEEIFQLDVRGLLERFRKDYTSFLKRMGKQYRTDRQQILSLALEPDENMDDGKIIELLETLQQYRVWLGEFEKNQGEAEKRLEAYYQGFQTDWQKLAKLLVSGKKLNDFNQKYGLTEEALHLCCASWDERSQFQIHGLSVEALDKNSLVTSLMDLTSPYKGRQYGRCMKAVRQQQRALEDFRSSVQTMEELICRQMRTFTGENCVFPEHPSSELLQEYIVRYSSTYDVIQNYKKAENSMQKYFPALYKGFDTEWEKIFYSWKHGKRVCEYALTHSLSVQTLALLKIPLEERQQRKIGDRTLMDLGFGNGRRDYVDFFNEHPGDIHITRREMEN